MAGLPGYPPPMTDALQSGIPGAFQPKGLAGVHPGLGPLFIPGRELEKAWGSHIPAAIPTLPTTAKKPGKWCAVHVRIAWEIYRNQQKSSDKPNLDSKELLRPLSHLHPVSTLSRAPDLQGGAASFLLGGPPGRPLLESSPNSHLSSLSGSNGSLSGFTGLQGLGNSLDATTMSPSLTNGNSGLDALSQAYTGFHQYAGLSDLLSPATGKWLILI
ncbi:probable fibrosin-1 [Dreissena polymorpha]|uniref:probable fibrosin-1 n=1 Tax=Dreissena polymorpha TaxID=45954 RepID=UPI00226539E4|nr:probable fibrosin-1 [Dreissena polymorpha]